MNNKANRAFALVGIFMIVVLAWDLGHRQGRQYLTSTAPEETNSPADASDTNNPQAADDTSKAETAPASSIGGDSVSVKNQLAGYEVQLSSLELSEMGWVGIRDNDGRVLGAGRFEAGTFANVAVQLLRATVAGDSYQALLYVDDGDKVFDLHKDTLVTSSNGGVSGTNFRAL